MIYRTWGRDYCFIQTQTDRNNQVRIDIKSFSLCYLLITSSSPNYIILQLRRDKTVIEMACGSDHSLVVTTEGKLFSFGNGKHGQVSEELDISIYPYIHQTVQ